MFIVFFFKQKTAYEMRISDWSSDVCSSDLVWPLAGPLRAARGARHTVYAITDRRLFILELYPRRRLRSFAPAELEAPRVQDRGKGRGEDRKSTRLNSSH